MLAKLGQGTIIKLYDVNLTEIIGIDSIFRFHSIMNHIRQSIVWLGNIHVPYSIKAIRFQKWARHEQSSVMVALNAFSLIAGLSHNYDVILSAHQVLAAPLGSANFEGGNNKADEIQKILPRYIIERMGLYIIFMLPK